MNSILEISHVKKSFDGVFALSDVTFDVKKGECVALVGENGAGKSTLMKILSGVWPHGSFQGAVTWEGKPLTLNSPLDGRKAGISIIHQELCLFPKMTVAENLFLTEAFPYDGTPSQSLFTRVHWDSLNERARALFQKLGFAVPAEALVEDLSVAQRQLVEIARAVHHNARLLILDEPTSALSQAEVQQLFAVIKRMRGEAISFIYISHKLDEVYTLADRIVVLRDGRAVKELIPDKTPQAEVIRHMVGRELTLGERTSYAKSEHVTLQVKHLSHVTPAGKQLLDDISFQVCEGEVLGIAGLMGSGRSELLRSLLGLQPGDRNGEVIYEGKPANWQGMEEALSAGIGFVPEDRKKDGLFLDLGVDFNLTISSLKELTKKVTLDLEKEEGWVSEHAKAMNVKASSYKNPIRTLSGGNQQKVLLAKMVSRNPKVLFLDEPTRGIDVGAKEEIYDIIRRLASTGISVVLVSSELPEVLALSDRVLVLKEGRAVGELKNQGLTQEAVMAFAAGGNHVS